MINAPIVNLERRFLAVKEKIKAWVKSYLYIPLCILCAYLLVGVVFICVIVPTQSMEPNYQAKHVYVGIRLVDKENMQRGTPVVFKNGSVLYLKRIIGLPGETISFSDDKVWINGTPLDESEYLQSTVRTHSPKEAFTVPDGCYFVMGDNRENSFDSRYWENPFVSADAVVGRMF